MKTPVRVRRVAVSGSSSGFDGPFVWRGGLLSWLAPAPGSGGEITRKRYVVGGGGEELHRMTSGTGLCCPVLVLSWSGLSDLRVGVWRVVPGGLGRLGRSPLPGEALQGTGWVWRWFGGRERAYSLDPYGARWRPDARFRSVVGLLSREGYSLEPCGARWRLEPAFWSCPDSDVVGIGCCCGSCEIECSSRCVAVHFALRRSAMPDLCS